MKYKQYNFSTNLTENLPLRVSTHVCKSIEWCEPRRIQVHMRDVNHTLNHRQKVHYSPLPRDAGLLHAALPVPHQIKVTTCCWQQDSCPAILSAWDWHMYNQSMPLCHILYIPQYIHQCRPDTSVVSTALQYWNIQAQSLVAHFRYTGGCTLTLSSSSSEHPKSLWSICTTSAWPL